MARYFFHLLGPGESVLRDEEGQEFASIEDAEQEALESIREILSESALDGTGPAGRSLQIADEQGTVLKSLLYSDAVA